MKKNNKEKKIILWERIVSFVRQSLNRSNIDLLNSILKIILTVLKIVKIILFIFNLF